MPENISKVVAPSLGPDGWVYSSIKQADIVMSWFLASDYSQDTLMDGSIHSFGWLLHDVKDNKYELINSVRENLNNLLMKYFNSVDIEVVDSSDPKNPDYFTLSIYGQFTVADGIVYKLTDIIKINGSKFELMSHEINGD